MTDNFDFKKFLTENKLGAYSKVGKLQEGIEPHDIKEMQADLDAMPKGDEDDAPLDEPTEEGLALNYENSSPNPEVDKIVKELVMKLSGPKYFAHGDHRSTIGALRVGLDRLEAQLP